MSRFKQLYYENYGEFTISTLLLNSKQQNGNYPYLTYKNNEKYLNLMKFFIQGNELSYNNLIAYLETGKLAKY